METLINNAHDTWEAIWTFFIFRIKLVHVPIEVEIEWRNLA